MTDMAATLVTEEAALSVAGGGLRRYEMGRALIGVGADATVVVLEPMDDPQVSGVRDALVVCLVGEGDAALGPRFEPSGDGWDIFRPERHPPIHLFARLDRGCLSLGTVRCWDRRWSGDRLCEVTLRFDLRLSREVLYAVQPAPEPGPVPDVEWLALVETEPLQALEAFVHGWYSALEGAAGADGADGADGDDKGKGELPDMPEALAVLHRLADTYPAIRGFSDPLYEQPRTASGPLGSRLVFAGENQGTWDWSIPWPPEGADTADPPVWLTFDPTLATAETVVEEEPLSRFILQYVLAETQVIAPYRASTYVMPTSRLDPMRDVWRPVPLKPFLPMFMANRFFVAPGLLAQVSADDKEAIVSFGALHRGTLKPLREHAFRWHRFDG